MNSRSRPHRQVATGIIPGTTADERDQFSSMLSSYARERDSGERFEIRRHREFQAQLFNAGDVRTADQRLDARLEGTSDTPRRTREYAHARTSIETALQPDAQPAPPPAPLPASASMPRYNAITHQFAGGAPPVATPRVYVPEWQTNNMFVSAAGVASQPMKGGGVDSLRWQQEARQHAEAAARDARTGLRAGPQYDPVRRSGAFNIVSNVPDGADAVPRPTMESSQRTLATHSRYTFDVLTGENKMHSPVQRVSVDPRVAHGDRAPGETGDLLRRGRRHADVDDRHESITTYNEHARGIVDRIDGLRAHAQPSRAHEQSQGGGFGPPLPEPPRRVAAAYPSAVDHVADVFARPPNARHGQQPSMDPSSRVALRYGPRDGGVHNALTDASMGLPAGPDAMESPRGRRHVGDTRDHLWVARADPDPPERRHKRRPYELPQERIGEALAWARPRPSPPTPRGSDPITRTLSSMPLAEGEVLSPRVRETAAQRSTVGTLMRGPAYEDSPYNSPRNRRVHALEM